MVEEVRNPRAHRILRVDLQNGKLLPAETIWEGDRSFLGDFGDHQVISERYFVTPNGGVIDMRDKKVLRSEQNLKFCGIDGTKIVYRKDAGRREDVYSFNLFNYELLKEEENLAEKYSLNGNRSPDGNATIEGYDELILNQVGSKPKSLGKGFIREQSTLESLSPVTPVLWLNNKLILTQRGNGKLVTVDVEGKVTDLLSIKEEQKRGGVSLYRDGSNRIIYSRSQNYVIDVEKRTATVSEWEDVGNGFEIEVKPQKKFVYGFRYNGKNLGSIYCLPRVKTAPGLLAVAARDDLRDPEYDGIYGGSQCVAVWSVEFGEWQTIKLLPRWVVGWFK